MKLAANLEDFEGLIFKTTVLVLPHVEDDFDDVQQLLRIKVWKVLAKYDPARSQMTVKAYVFGCLMNYKKDLKKRRRRGELFIEDLLPDHPSGDGQRHDGSSAFEARHLAVSQDVAFLAVEDETPLLPNTLNDLERRVIGLLMLEYTATEISRTLSIGPKRLRAVRNDIERKMMDWRPSAVHQPAPLDAVAA
jgi:DNA-directed RNA polymerase specialized sigma24 family protein